MDETITILVDGAEPGAAPEAIEIPSRIGSVKLAERLGEGSGGIVFSGFDEALDRRVAVKLLRRRAGLLDDSAIGELAEGVRAAARIKHANIVTVHSVELVHGMAAIVMEHVDGVSMRELLSRLGPLDAPTARALLIDISSAVGALHEAGVIHRDLKPANILFDRDGAAHVCDFGLACDFDPLRFRGQTTSIGGSPLYMAPEVFDGHVSPQSDVYSLGVMLFETLCGRPPFSGDSLSEVQTRHRAAAPPIEWLEQAATPGPLQDVVARALHKQRYLRFKNATRLLHALESLELPGPAPSAIRLRVAEAVNAPPDAGNPAAPPPTPLLQNTYDLVARRAEEKRRRT